MRGHNEDATIRDFIEKRRAIWACRVPVPVKIIALAIMEHMSPENLECWPSKDRLAFMCNMPRKTFDRHYPAAKELFLYHDRKGKTTKFSPKILDVAKELMALWPAKDDPVIDAKLRYKPSHKMRGGQNEGDPKMTLPQNGKTPPQFGGHTPPQIGGANRQRRDKLEDPPNARDKYDPFGLNPHRSEMVADVWFDGDDRLQVGNGFRTELLQLAGGEDQLRIELDRAAEWIGPNTPPQVMKTKVRGRIQTQISERHDRDKRYERAKSASKPRDDELAGVPKAVRDKIMADKARARSNA